MDELEPVRRRRRRRGRLGVVGVVTTAVAASCLASATIGSRQAGPGLVEPAPATLESFGDCAGVRDWYVDAALPHVTAWGLEDAAGPPANVAESARDGFAFDPRGSGPTGTNLQESGVDEPDVAKTDGARAVTLDGPNLVVSDVTGTRPRELGRVRVPGARGGRLLLADDRAVVVGGRRGRYDALDAGRLVRPVRARTRVSVVDLGEPTAPAVRHSRRIDGSLVAARVHDGVVRVAVSSAPSLPFVTPNPNVSPARARAENRRIVRESTISDWLPTTTVDGRSAPLVDCTQVSHPSRAAGVGTITVLGFEPDDPAATAASAVTADGSLVYASANRFYVATTDDGWRWHTGRATDGSTTEIHAFAVNGSSTPYVASGAVAGHVPERWALSEYDGVLRVAAEQGRPWAPRETVVSALAERGDTLRVVGSVGGMGEREQIRAVRWFGDVGVVVTFRQTDPLYTLDLSEPASPRISDELKIRGYSAYLHPVGRDRLVGVGQAADGRGLEHGVQVSSFGLSDLRRPVLMGRLALGRRWSHSPVAHNSRAFTYLPAQRLMFVPVRGGDGARIEVVRVSPAGDLRAVRAIATPPEGRGVRALPLAGDRVAIVAGGSIVRIADAAAFG